MASTLPSVAVVGSGVIGITSALSILEQDPSIKVTIIADRFTPDNTTDGAAGLIMPVILQDTPAHLRRRWFAVTLTKFGELLKSDAAPQIGVFKISGYVVSDSPQEVPDWKDQVCGFRQMTEQELADFPLPAKGGCFLTTIVAQGTHYMPWLMKRVQDLGGIFVKRRIKSLQELAGHYDVVVNCTGMGARELLGDKLIRPVRGQVLRVNAPWVKHFWYYLNTKDAKKGRVAYIIPQIDQVVLGGTEQFDNYNTKPTIQDTVNILEDTSKIIPSLKNAKIVKNWAGLRPGRKTVRLEKEVMKFRDESGRERTLNVVHNYGHGGSGPSVSFGCAVDCCELVFEFLAGRTKAKL